MEEIRILSPQGMLGYGFSETAFENGLKKNPHAICVDAGSTDGGPQKLGLGVGITSKKIVKRDLGLMLDAGLSRKIPVLIGSAGGSGGNPHVKWTLDIVKELAKEKGIKIKTAVIHSSLDKEWVKKMTESGKVVPLPGAPELNSEEIDLSTEIVAQMGYESFMPALEAGVDLIIAGRSYDPAMTAAVCVHHGMDVGLAYHMGKILECGPLCAVPGSAKDCMMGNINKDDFVVEALHPIRFCTPYSVAAHTLYEKGHPYLLPSPGGVSDLSQCTFTQITPQSVQVKGSKFLSSDEYMVKMEGAKLSGYRSVFVAGIREPLAVASVDEMIKAAQEIVDESFPESNGDGYMIDCKIYGKNGVMGESEPLLDEISKELCVVTEVVAPTQEEAAAICALFRSTMLHYHYTGRYATAGNLAFPFAPSDFDAGAVYEFNVYHLVPIDSPESFFKTDYLEIG